MTFVFLSAVLAVTPTPSPDSPRVSPGRWGGIGISLEVTESDARIELDCAHGTIQGPLALDADGGFDRPGLIVREGPGPVRMGDESQPEGVPVRYVGRLEGQTLTIKIVWPNVKEPKPLSARLGQNPRLRKCG